jgi:multimeric flavodoxin WrbA
MYHIDHLPFVKLIITRIIVILIKPSTTSGYMKVLGIVAGPRKKGNTARLVEEVISGAESAGHETHIFYMSEMKVNPLDVDEKGYLYPGDDFNKLMPHLESMDALVLGSPIYYDQVSSRAKLFIDRLYYYSGSHGDEFRKLFPDNVKFVSVVTCGWDNPNVYGDVVEWLHGRMTHYWKMKIHGALKAYGTGSEPVRNNSKLLGKARALGLSL